MVVVSPGVSLTRSVRFLMARLTPFSDGGSRAFSRNRAMEPSFSIWAAHDAKQIKENRLDFLKVLE